ncbi:MAG: zinc ribbon domain-containing protein [Desulfobacter sp.]|nr:MAG: zinc ribbon domain-containing protein [Desulfobacter sp.]
MPIYEYKCSQCEAEFEKLVFTGDDQKIECPKCHSIEVTKKMSAASLTGSGKCSPSGTAGAGSGFS